MPHNGHTLILYFTSKSKLTVPGSPLGVLCHTACAIWIYLKAWANWRKPIVLNPKLKLVYPSIPMPSGKRSDRPARRIGCQIGLAQKHINTHTNNRVQNSGVPSQVRPYFFSVDPLLDRSIAVVVLPNLKHLAYHMSLIYYHLWFMMYHWVIKCDYVHLKSSIPTPKLGPSNEMACCKHLKASPRAPGLCLRLWKAFSKQCRYCDSEKSGRQTKASARQQQRLKPAQTYLCTVSLYTWIYLNRLNKSGVWIRSAWSAVISSCLHGQAIWPCCL